MEPYKVLIVDDENMHRQLFQMIVQKSENYVLIGELSSAKLVPQFCRDKKIDLVIMDVVMKDDSNGLDAAEEVKKLYPEIKILIVTSMPETTFLKRAREIGVESFWYKEVQDVPLLNVMDRTMAGENVYPDSIPIVTLGLAKNTDLTERELEVLRELVAGCSNQEIGERLFISVNTVRSHISTLLSKTGCVTRTELAIRAAKSGMFVVKE